MTYDKVTYCGDVRGEKTRLVSLNAELTPEREKSLMDPA